MDQHLQTKMTMKILNILLLSAVMSTVSAVELRELPTVSGSPQLIQSSGLLSKLKLLSESNDIEHKQLLIDCLEYSFGPYGDEKMELEEKIPALGLAEQSMGELEISLVVFSALKTDDPVLRNRLGLLTYKLTKGAPAAYGKKLGFLESDKVGEFLLLAESTKDLEELAFFEGFTENPKMLEFLKKLNSHE